MEREYTGSYPIILDGSETGAVSVSREGLFWRFEAKCEMREELVRLSVYGGGAEGYLGVMEPREGVLCLTKKLSRNAVSVFPESISYATRAGERPPELPCECEEASPPEGESEAEGDCDAPPEDDKPPPAAAAFPLAAQGGVWRHCPNPCSLFPDIGAKSVCGGLYGALMQSRSDGVILAVPEVEAAALPENNILIFSETEIISGRRYCLARVMYI